MGLIYAKLRSAIRPAGVSFCGPVAHAGCWAAGCRRSTLGRSCPPHVRRLDQLLAETVRRTCPARCAVGCYRSPAGSPHRTPVDSAAPRPLAHATRLHPGACLDTRTAGIEPNADATTGQQIRCRRRRDHRRAKTPTTLRGNDLTAGALERESWMSASRSPASASRSPASALRSRDGRRQAPPPSRPVPCRAAQVPRAEDHLEVLAEPRPPTHPGGSPRRREPGCCLAARTARPFPSRP